jgi:hypothetical protein
VLREHTPGHRAQQLEDYYREALARRSRPSRWSTARAANDTAELKLGLS